LRGDELANGRDQSDHVQPVADLSFHQQHDGANIDADRLDYVLND
jgi:hypothetical protein